MLNNVLRPISPIYLKSGPRKLESHMWLLLYFYWTALVCAGAPVPWPPVGRGQAHDSFPWTVRAALPKQTEDAY